MEYFFLICIIISICLSILLFVKKEKNQADFILASWLLIVAIHLFAYYSFISGLLIKNEWLLNLNLPYPFFHGPFLYLYTRAISSQKNLELKYFLLHFMLPFGLIMSFLPITFLEITQKKELILGNLSPYESFFAFQGMLLNLTGLYYTISTFLVLQKHKKNILNQFSNKEKVTLDWLRFLFYSMTALWIVIIFIQNDILIFTGAAIFVLLIGYFGLRQPGIFIHNPEVSLVEELLDGLSFPETKYAKSGLNDALAKDIHENLKCIMENEKPYLNAELSLKELSLLLNVNSNYLSQVINELEGMNFYDYINGFRFLHFKSLLDNPENSKYTLLALAYDSGFNSKSTFNRFFKKQTGISPKEYMNNLQTKD